MAQGRHITLMLETKKLYEAIRTFLMTQRIKIKSDGQIEHLNPELNILQKEIDKYFSNPMGYTAREETYKSMLLLATKQGFSYDPASPPTPPRAQRASESSNENEPPSNRNSPTPPRRAQKQSSELMAFLKRVSGMDFDSLSAQEKAEVLYNNRHREELDSLIKAELRTNKNFLNEIVLSSAQAAKQILGSRLGFNLSNKEVAAVLYAHRDKIVPVTFANPRNFTPTEISDYERELQNLLGKTRRDLQTLLSDPECYAILKQSGRFEALKSGRPMPTPPPQSPPRQPSPSREPQAEAPKRGEAWNPSAASMNIMADRQKKQDFRDLAKAIEERVDYYEFIGVKKDADEDEIRKACRKKKVEIARNPDDGNKSAQMSKVGAAEKFLLNPEFKKVYDEGIKNKNPHRRGL